LVSVWFVDTSVYEEGAMIHYILYILFSIGVIIEIISVYLDWRIMIGKGRTSGAWGVAFGIFVLFGLYGLLLGNRRNEPFTLTREAIIAYSLIGFQIAFHILLPLIRIYRFNRNS